MRQTRLMMGMPITVEVVDAPDDTLHGLVFAYFEAIDSRFSTYRSDSEISAFNTGRIGPDSLSAEMVEVLELAALTRAETDGYFDIQRPDGRIDPSGIVKGWAIRNAARLLAAAGVVDYFVDAGGDIQGAGRNVDGKPWRAGIRSPFDPNVIVKHIYPRWRGVATSGSYARGQHIYDPHQPGAALSDVVSLTVIGEDVLEADRFATAAFAMGRDGIAFIESRPGLEGYQIDRRGIATMSTGFESLTAP